MPISVLYMYNIALGKEGKSPEKSVTGFEPPKENFLLLVRGAIPYTRNSERRLFLV